MTLSSTTLRPLFANMVEQGMLRINLYRDCVEFTNPQTGHVIHGIEGQFTPIQVARTLGVEVQSVHICMSPALVNTSPAAAISI